ncbi:TIGR01777 family oxidoreductase [Mucilaginibacter angelicae]|uniref:TIGR01777 family oxidoreductase n=1 Tax=Mucilaginibacter angelicae TaxID=869718 RepID=A0ABV6L8N5_9SPHI
MRSILLTGGSGLLGTHLTKALLAKGYTVSYLSRKAGNDARVKTFVWDINKGIINDHCIDGVDTIVHLAGSGIAEKRWTDARKKDLIDSRVKSIELVYDLLKRKQHQVTSIISASGIGYYSDRGDELMFETSTPTGDFISQCCVLWEAAVDEGEKLGARILKFRTGVVLDKDGGALPTLAKPVKLFIGSPIGSGKQWVPWIHWQDVVDMYLLGIENKDLKGVYNMVAPNPVTNKQLTRAVAKQLHKPLWAPDVPGFVIKLLLGEMSSIVLGSTKVSAQKIEGAGFKFKYADIDSALTEIYG